MKKRWFILTLVLVIVFASTITGCNKSADENGTISIGISVPLSGSSSAVGEELSNGAALAVKLANESGKLEGKTIKLVVRDDKGDSKEAATISSEFAENSNIVGVVGHYFSSSTLAAAPNYNKGKLPAIAAGSSAPAVSEAGEYVYRVVMSDQEQSKSIAQWSIDMGLQKVAIVYENDDYGAGLKDNYAAAFEALGGEIVDTETFTSGQTKDFSTIIATLKSLNVEGVVLACSDCDAPLILSQSKNSGFVPQFLGVDALFAQSVIDNSNGAAEGLIIPGFFDVESQNTEVVDFIAAYKAEYGTEPGSFAGYSFDATDLIINAIIENGASREQVKEYLDTVVDFAGITGKTTFDKNGDVLKTALKFQVTDNAFKIVG